MFSYKLWQKVWCHCETNVVTRRWQMKHPIYLCSTVLCHEDQSRRSYGTGEANCNLIDCDVNINVSIWSWSFNRASGVAAIHCVGGRAVRFNHLPRAAPDSSAAPSRCLAVTLSEIRPPAGKYLEFPRDPSLMQSDAAATDGAGCLPCYSPQNVH